MEATYKHSAQAGLAVSSLLSVVMALSAHGYRLLAIPSLLFASILYFGLKKRSDKVLFVISYLAVAVYSLAIGRVYNPLSSDWRICLWRNPVVFFVAIR